MKTKVALIGAGAVGSYLIWGMTENSDIEFTLVAEGERAERLKKQGVCVNHKVRFPKVLSSNEAGVQDLVLIATKYQGLSDAISYLDSLTDSHTIVMSLLNGVDSEEKIVSSDACHGTVLYSLMRIAANRGEEGTVFDPECTGGIFFGPDGPQQNPEDPASIRHFDECAKRVAACLAFTKLRYTSEENIYEDIWNKFAANIANNLPQAVLFTDASLYTDSEHGFFIAARLWEEVRTVAFRTKGIVLSEVPRIFYEVPKTSHYSTLQDLEAKRETEIDMFAGQILKLAAAAGILVPYTEFVFHAVKALEEKNRGIIGN